MNEAASPPGGTSVHAEPDDPRDAHDHSQQQPRREGVDTEGLRDYRELRRDTYDRKIAGVCGGLARHLDIDPTLVRVVMVVLVFFGGAGLILYAALWLFVPELGTDKALVPIGDSTRNVVVIIALVLAVLIALPSGIDGDGGAFVGLLLLAGVVAVVLLTRDSTRRTPVASAGAPPTGAPTGSPAAPGAGPVAGDSTWSTGWSGVTVPPPPTAPPGTPPYSRPPRPRRRGPLLFGLVLASVVLALGVLGLVDASGVPVPDAGYPALALAVIGAWLVIGSVFGRPGGVVLLGIVALLGLSVAQISEPSFDGDRDLLRRPAQASQLADHYDLPAGRAEIDLRGIRDLEKLDGRSLRVDLNAGEIQLIVPDDLTVDLNADIAGGGEISTPGGNRNGWGVDVTETIEGDPSRATLDVDLDVGFGRILVRSE